MAKRKGNKAKVTKTSELVAETGKLAMRLGVHEIEVGATKASEETEAIPGVKFQVKSLSGVVDAFIRDSATRTIEAQLTNPAGEKLVDDQGQPRMIQYPKQDEHAKARLAVAFGIVGWGDGLVARMPDGKESPIEYQTQSVEIHNKQYERITDEVMDKLVPLIGTLSIQVLGLTHLVDTEKKSCSSGGGSVKQKPSVEPGIAQA